MCYGDYHYSPASAACSRELKSKVLEKGIDEHCQYVLEQNGNCKTESANLCCHYDFLPSLDKSKSNHTQTHLGKQA